MKRFILIFAAFLLTLPLLAQEKSPPLKDQKDKVSYSIGLNIGTNLSRQNVEINPEALSAGIKDGIAGKPQLTQDQIKEVMTAFEKDMQQRQKVAGEKSAAEGAKFLEDNKKKEGVKTTASGLQYKVMKEGTGAQPKATDTVTVNYLGTLINGKEFDSSYKRGQPATFPLNGVIKGWTEGLQLMKTGSKYQFFVPSNLAYGERAAGPDISPNSTLIFEIELLEVKPPPTPSTPAAAGPPGKTVPQASPPGKTVPQASPPSKPSPSPSPKAVPR
jgi:FKBP-type peptidyl-prolyl cis-trans isomerase FklB